MLRTIVAWILFKFHIGKPKKEVDLVQTLIDLLPYVLATSIILGAVKYLGLEYSMPWYIRLHHWLKRRLRQVRSVLIGY